MATLMGQTLGGYRLIQQIGLGGMATVYKAYQPAMERYVALKIISGHLTQDSAFVQRFQQEARVIAKLEHAHILPVYDSGHEAGYFYLAMRLIETGTLSDRLKTAPLTLAEIRRVVTQVGSALAHAHRLGIIHRDFKPSNVLVDAQGNCYLTDFGIAKMVEGTLGLTGGGILGTPHYMAPEQGRSQQVDQRADIYAMGIVIYEMATGQVPYNAETPFAVMLKHISEPLPLPRTLKPDLPEAVERVILKALAKAPADRYQSMAELVTAFQQASDRPLSREATALTPPATVEQTQVPTAVMAPSTAFSRRVIWGVAGLLLLSVSLALVIFSQNQGSVEVTPESSLLVENTPTVPTVLPSSTPQPVITQAPLPTPTTAAATFTPTPVPPTFTPTPGPTSTPLPDAVVNAAVTNLWAGPGSSYAIIGQTKSGENLRVTGRNSPGDWLQVVTSDGMQGWAALMWLKVNIPLDGVALVAAPPTATPTPTSTTVPTVTSTPQKLIPTLTAAPPTPTPLPALPSPTPTPIDKTEQLIIEQILQTPLLGGDKQGVILVNCEGAGPLDWYIEEPKSEYRLVAKIPAPYEGHCGVSHLEGLFVGMNYEFGFLAPWLSGLQIYRFAGLPAGQIGVMYFGQAMEEWGAHADLKAKFGAQQ